MKPGQIEASLASMPDISQKHCRYLFTFDDGPDPRQTPRLLDVLAKHDIKALFFVLGLKIKSREGQRIIRQAAAAGHLIGNHAYSHQNLTTLPEKRIRQEILETQSLIGDASGDIRLFRPPYGEMNAVVEGIAAELGFETILWDLDTWDWLPVLRPGGWVAYTTAQVGSERSYVLLSHDIHPTTVTGLDKLIQSLRSLPVKENEGQSPVLRPVPVIPSTVPEDFWWTPQARAPRGWWEASIGRWFGRG